jgi:large subunit ribosomal protein L13
MNTTLRLKASDIAKDWHVIDAAGRSLGRVATEAAVLLRGKHKPTYEPHLDDGDFVIIVNASRVQVTGRKAGQITYYRHSGYPGGLKSRSYTEQLERFPERVVERAVKGMLPSGPLGEKMALHLKVYRGPKHPHESQVTYTERSRALRAALLEEHAADPMVPPKLRPLRRPQVEEPAPVVEEPVAVVAPPDPVPAEAPAEEPKPRARRRKTAAEPAPEAAVEPATAEAPVAAEAVVVEPAAEPAETEKKPRRRAARKTQPEPETEE